MTHPKPALLLFFLSPLLAEYLTGSSPLIPFNPLWILINIVLYGAGSLLIHEAVVRWSAGWRGVFLLAAAYAVVEEGIMLGTLFNPGQNTMGRAWGVNWVWTSGLLDYHILFSISFPLVFVAAIFPNVGLYLADVLLLATTMAYRPAAVYYLVEAGIIAACVYCAFAAGRRAATEIDSHEAEVAPPWRFAAFGFAGTLTWCFFAYVLQSIYPSPALIIAGHWLSFFVLIGILARMSGQGKAWRSRHQLALVVGVLVIPVLLSVVQTVMRKNPSTLIAAVAVVVILFKAFAAVRQQENVQANEVAA
jgi:hypothetical protein